MKLKWKPFIVCLAIPLITGGLAGILTRDAQADYQSLAQPPLSPPGWVFPVVWTVLFLLMGVSSYLVYVSDSPRKGGALTLYGVQLLVNFIWPLVFFGAQSFLAALILLAVLWILVFAMIIVFHRIKPAAGWLQLPYITWLTFAAYLNLAAYLING